MRRTLIALALLLAATGAHAQAPTRAQLDSVRVALDSLRADEVRARAFNRSAETVYTRIIARTDTLVARLTRLIAAASEPPSPTAPDSTVAPAPPPVDTVVPPPPPDTTTAPPDTTAPGMSLTGDWQAPGVILSITQDGSDLHGTTPDGATFEGELKGDSVSFVFDNGPVFRGALVTPARIVGTLTGSTWSVTWPLERIGPPPDPGQLLDLVLTMGGTQGLDFSLHVGEVREMCVLGLYEHAVMPPPDVPVWSSSDPTALQLGAQGPSGPHCRMVTALRETDDALGWGVPAGAVAWLARRVR